MSSSETAKLRIATARDLFEALNSEQLGVRLSMLAAICKAPDKAVSYGPHGGRGLVEELAAQLEGAGDKDLRRALAATLAIFDDARVLKALAGAYRSSHDMQEIMVCAQRLAVEPGPDYTDMFLSCLRSDDKPLQARAAANALAGASDLEHGDRVRVALLCDVDYDVPPLDSASASAWVRELAGSHRERAMALLKTQGMAAWRGLREAWDDLPGQAKAWLLEWGCRDFPEAAGELCLNAIGQGDDDIQLAALQAASLLPALSPELNEAMVPFLESPDRELRLAAIKAMDSLDGARDLLDRESDPRLRLALIPHLLNAHGEEAAADLAALLESDDWRLRGAAAQALKELGKAGQEAARNLSDHPRLEVRLAAAQVLAD